MDKELKEEIYKCSKCGLCKSVCPIYLATKNEMYLPRGRFIILNSLFNNKPSNEFLNNLDICLHCNLCKDFCPSNINSAEIFTGLKKPSKSLYLKLFFIFNLYRLFNLKRKYKPQKFENKEKVLYFEGCYNKYIDSSDRNATIKLIEELGYEVEKVVSNCCGYPYLTNNDNRNFKRNEEKIIANCNSKAKHIVCSCDSCYETLKKINNKEFTDKLIRLDDFLKQNNYQFNICNEAIYFKPLTKKDECYLPTEIKQETKKGACSLMENFFALKHPKLAKNIINKQEAIKAETIVTTCNVTKWGLIKNFKYKVLSYAEYLKKEVD